MQPDMVMCAGSPLIVIQGNRQHAYSTLPLPIVYHVFLHVLLQLG